MTRRPGVLCLSGHDPTGGAGLHADIEACAALGAHARSVPTALTCQDSNNVHAVHPVDPAAFDAMLALLLEDARPDAVKIGLLGSAAIARGIARRIAGLGVPVVLDPILRAGGGACLADDPLLRAMREALFPLVAVLTPNAAEARVLAPAGATALLEAGCASVLVTGGDEPGETVVNRWYRPGEAMRRFEWPRLPGRFHGAGCTLAAALAALLARGEPAEQAVTGAQAYAAQALARAHAIGRGRLAPGRLAPP